MARASWEQEATAMAGLQQHPSDHRRPRSPSSAAAWGFGRNFLGSSAAKPNAAASPDPAASLHF